MTWLKQVLTRFFRRTDALEADFSDRWKPHANRRTIVIILLAGLIAIVSYLYVIAPPDNFPLDALVSVPEGQTLAQTAQSLKDAGVIRSTIAFRVLVTLFGHERNLHAGDYLFKEPLDVFTISKAISIGMFGLEPAKIRVPEGATVKEMAIIFGARLQRFNEQRFLAQALPYEGYLYPDTYFFLPNATEGTVIETMRQNFDTHEAAVDATVKASGHSLDDIVIMASILEREAHATDDRRKIAGVLWNRLQKGMPLQVDATFLYTIGKGTFQLTLKDLATPSPYNTYVNNGLPPGPIGSPSLDSIEAAADPIPSDYLFYLADGNGVTHYCKDYTCQLANKAKYF